jgi:hypothetical protein
VNATRPFDIRKCLVMEAYKAVKSTEVNIRLDVLNRMTGVGRAEKLQGNSLAVGGKGAHALIFLHRSSEG